MRMMSGDDLRRTSRTILKTNYLRLFSSYYSDKFDVKSVGREYFTSALTFCCIHCLYLARLSEHSSELVESSAVNMQDLANY